MGWPTTAKPKACIFPKYSLSSILCPPTLFVGLLTTWWALSRGYCWPWNLSFAERKRVPRHSMQIALKTSQSTENQTDLTVQQVTTASQRIGQVLQSTRTLKQPNKRVRNNNSRTSHVNPLDESSRPFTNIVNPEKRNKMFLLRKKLNKIFVNIGPIFLVMRKLPVILGMEAVSNFLRKDQLTPFLKAQVLHVSYTTKVHNANNKSLQTIGSIELCVQIGIMRELVNFFFADDWPYQPYSEVNPKINLWDVSTRKLD